MTKLSCANTVLSYYLCFLQGCEAAISKLPSLQVAQISEYIADNETQVSHSLRKKLQIREKARMIPVVQNWNQGYHYEFMVIKIHIHTYK